MNIYRARCEYVTSVGQQFEDSPWFFKRSMAQDAMSKKLSSVRQYHKFNECGHKLHVEKMVISDPSHVQNLQTLLDSGVMDVSNEIVEPMGGVLTGSYDVCKVSWTVRAENRFESKLTFELRFF